MRDFRLLDGEGLGFRVKGFGFRVNFSCFSCDGLFRALGFESGVHGVQDHSMLAFRSKRVLCVNQGDISSVGSHVPDVDPEPQIP